MKRTHEKKPVDLGRASSETKGYAGLVDDTKGGFIPTGGISDE